MLKIFIIFILTSIPIHSLSLQFGQKSQTKYKDTYTSSIIGSIKPNYSIGSQIARYQCIIDDSLDCIELDNDNILCNRCDTKYKKYFGFNCWLDHVSLYAGYGTYNKKYGIENELELFGTNPLENSSIIYRVGIIVPLLTVNNYNIIEVAAKPEISFHNQGKIQYGIQINLIYELIGYK